MTWPNISPELYAKLLNCQVTSCSVEQRFSILHKLLAKDRYFSPDNVWKYLALGESGAQWDLGHRRTKHFKKFWET